MTKKFGLFAVESVAVVVARSRDVEVENSVCVRRVRACSKLWPCFLRHDIGSVYL